MLQHKIAMSSPHKVIALLPFIYGAITHTDFKKADVFLPPPQIFAETWITAATEFKNGVSVNEDNCQEETFKLSETHAAAYDILMIFVTMNSKALRLFKRQNYY